MIVDLPNTTTNDINKRITSLREEGGAITLGRVLTLVVAPDTRGDPRGRHRGRGRRPAGSTPAASSWWCPSTGWPPSRDWTANCGSAATPAPARWWCCKTSGPLADHASSVVLPFLLPDTPVVAWWPGTAPEVPAQDPLGRLAIRRITDATGAEDPLAIAAQPADGLHPGRHRPGLEPDHLLAGTAGLGAGPAALRAGHRRRGVRVWQTNPRWTSWPAGWPAASTDRCAARSASSRWNWSSPARPSR